ncbi:MAG TPA: glycosyltransferase [Jatrophihabitans sp.]|nr:glycosyltransferase [Jatrophihabitans sp.]
MVATRNRLAQLRQTLPRHHGPVILVDNGSTDGTAAAVRREFPHVSVVELGRNRGAPARNVGVRLARTDLVAFADDDSWWQPGALAHAAAVFARHPDLGLIAAQVLVGQQQQPDPTSRAMAHSPLPGRTDLPGPSVLGFLACGAVLRRSAFLQAGGFDPVVFFFGEEERLALDLAAAGWQSCYLAEVIAHHQPELVSHRSDRTALADRNRLLTALMRRPWPEVARIGWQCLKHGEAGRAGVRAALPRLLPALRRRHRLPARVEADRRSLDRVTLPEPGPIGAGALAG